MEIAVAYISIFLLALVISIPKFKEIAKSYKEGKREGKKFDEIFATKLKSKNKADRSKNIEELKTEKKFLISDLKILSHRFLYLLNFPVGILRLSLMFRYGQTFLWKVPFHIYEIWWFMLLALCFRAAGNGSVTFAIIISSMFTVSMVFEIISNLEIKNNSLKIQSTPEHKLHISDLIIEGISVVTGFACIFYCISILNPGAFNQKLSIIDAIYFSFMVGTTVGLGHIHPASQLAQILTIVEALLGVMFVVFLVAIFISVWMSKKTHQQTKEGDKIV